MWDSGFQLFGCRAEFTASGPSGRITLSPATHPNPGVARTTPHGLAQDPMPDLEAEFRVFPMRACGYLNVS